MPEAFVTLASYHMPVEAQLARGRLEAEGIQAVLHGGGSVGRVRGHSGAWRTDSAARVGEEADAERSRGHPWRPAKGPERSDGGEN